MPKYRFRILCVVAANLLAALPASAEPEVVWTQGYDSGSVYTDIQIVPEHEMLVATDGDVVKFIDLKNGALIDDLAPHSDEISERLVIKHVRASADYVLVITELYSGGGPERFPIFLYDTKTREELHRIRYPEEFAGHSPSVMTPSTTISKNDLLILFEIFERSEDQDQVMMQFDAVSGQFVRAIGAAEIDEFAKEGWFGSRPEVPDRTFSTAIVDQRVIYVSNLSDDSDGREILTYNLDQSSRGPAYPGAKIGASGHVLMDVDGSDIYALTVTRNNTDTLDDLSVVRASRETGEVLATYADPFAPETEDVAPEDAIMHQIEHGELPYVFSGFGNGPFWRMQDHVYIGADAARISGQPEELAFGVFEIATGKLATTLTADDFRADWSFGAEFGQSDDLLAVSRYLEDPMATAGPFQTELTLYRLEQ